MNHSVAAWSATQPSRLVETNKVGVSLFFVGGRLEYGERDTQRLLKLFSVGDQRAP